MLHHPLRGHLLGQDNNNLKEKWRLTAWLQTKAKTRKMMIKNSISLQTKQRAWTHPFLPAGLLLIPVQQWKNEWKRHQRWILCSSSFPLLHTTPPSHLSRSWEKLSLKSECRASSWRSLGCRLSQQLWSFLSLYYHNLFHRSSGHFHHYYYHHNYFRSSSGRYNSLYKSPQTRPWGRQVGS